MGGERKRWDWRGWDKWDGTRGEGMGKERREGEGKGGFRKSPPLKNPRSSTGI